MAYLFSATIPGMRAPSEDAADIQRLIDAEGSSFWLFKALLRLYQALCFVCCGTFSFSSPPSSPVHDPAYTLAPRTLFPTLSSCAGMPRWTCAMVFQEIAKSRSVVTNADSSAQTKKFLNLQLQQLEQVVTIVQKGESLVIDGKCSLLAPSHRRHF